MPSRVWVLIASGSLLLIQPPANAQAPVTQPASPIEAGRAAFAAEQYHAAYTRALEAYKAAPEKPEPFELAGRAAMALGDPASAVRALNSLTKKRGTLYDWLLLSTAFEMTGNWEARRQSLEKAAAAKEPTPQGLHAIASEMETAPARLALLKRISSEFPGSGPDLAPEISFWESRGDARLREVSQPAPEAGVVLKMKTLYDVEWVVCTVGGEEVWLLVDTASPITILSEDTARRLKLASVASAYPRLGAYEGEKAHPYTLIPKLDFGPYAVANVPALVLEDSTRLLTFREGRVVLKGILGMDLLRGLKVRFDRQKNELRLFPKEAPLTALLDGNPSEWSDGQAFSVHGQAAVRSSVGENGPLLALLSTACEPTVVTDSVMNSAALKATTRHLVDFGPGATLILHADVRASRMERNRNVVLGWIEEALPQAGRIKTVEGTAKVGFGPVLFMVQNLPIYPFPLGSDAPLSAVIGQEGQRPYAIALDLSAGKFFIKQVLFKKG